MKLTIIYDNEVYEKSSNLKSDWGFACLIETKGEIILFDCGARGSILLNNMQKLGINSKTINKIVISHEHWDHNGGLEVLIPLNDDVELYRLGKNDFNKKIKLKHVEETQMISEGIYTTGRLPGSPVDEQSLVLEGKKGWYVLVGCSHSGVENILQVSKKFGNILGIIGGLHCFDDFSILAELDFICPCHCTKYKKKLKKIYPTKFVECGCGRIIDI